MTGLNRIHTSLVTLAAGALISTAAQAGAILISPGTVAGYIPLSLFGGNTVVPAGDDTISNFTVGNYKFGGQDWNSIGVGSNGYIVVGGGSTADIQFLNKALPDGTAPRNLLAPFWTDLNPMMGGTIRVNTLTDGVSDWVVIDWDGVANFDGSGTNTFEVWIGLNGFEEIAFAYGAVTAGSSGLLTVGAQDASGTVGNTYYFNGVGTAPTAGGDVLVVTRDLPVIVAVPEPGSLLLAGAALWGLAATRRRRA
jgi:hypothetical protein